MKMRIAGLLGVWLVAGSVGAAEYHVAKTGSDAAEGTAAHPWRTIQKAAETLVAGDTVVVHAGVYREWVRPANAGRANARITYCAAPGEKVVVSGADALTDWERLPDGRWRTTLANNAFGGLDPFAARISGNWFVGQPDVVYWRTKLTQAGETLLLYDDHAPDSPDAFNRMYLCNLAGITGGGLSLAGADHAASHDLRPGFQTKWGLEIGYIHTGSWALYRGFDFRRPESRTVTLHASAPGHAVRVEVRANASDGPVLGEALIPPTGSWDAYKDVPVSLAAVATDVRDLCVVFYNTKGDGLTSPGDPGTALLRGGLSHGTIEAAFRQDPRTVVPELVTRPACFYPVKTHRDYITVRGFEFRDAGPQWAPPTSEQMAVVGSHWSRGWIVEDCEIHGSCCAGLSFGKYGDEFDNFSDDSQRYTGTIARALTNGLDRVGHHVARRCRIYDCKQAGIVGSLGAVFSRVEDCDIYDIHRGTTFGGAEMAGIKFHGAVDCSIVGNRIHHCDAEGIWFDWMGQGSRVTGNRLWANGRDLFFEVDHGPLLVDNNDILSPFAMLLISQSVAFVGNRIAGRIVFQDDDRRTPIFRPHTVDLVKMEVPCHPGGYRYINNLMATAPDFAKPAHAPASVAEDNFLVPAACWKIDDATGSCTVEPPADAVKPAFRAVDTARLGGSTVLGQPFAEPDGTPVTLPPARW